MQCDLDGHVTDLVLQGSNGDGDLTCPDLSTGIAALPRLNRLDLAGATLGAPNKGDEGRRSNTYVCVWKHLCLHHSHCRELPAVHTWVKAACRV